MTNPAFILRVLEIAAKHDHRECLFWRVDNGDVQFSVNCSDTFEWGTADVEDLTADNVEMFAATLAEADLIGQGVGGIYGPTLFCSRVRKMRPQGAAYPASVPELWPLLDACGPERETGLGNPYKPGEYKPERLAQ